MSYRVRMTFELTMKSFDKAWELADKVERVVEGDGDKDCGSLRCIEKYVDRVM